MNTSAEKPQDNIIQDGTLIVLDGIDVVQCINAYQFDSCKMHVFSNKTVNEITSVIPSNAPLKALI
jgi:hypothetical protein